jgi:hypothetical protein
MTPSNPTAEWPSSAAGAACKHIEARKTRMAAPVSFTRLFGLIYLACPLFCFLAIAGRAPHVKTAQPAMHKAA